MHYLKSLRMRSFVMAGAALLIILIYSGAAMAVTNPRDVVFEAAPVDSHLYAQYLDPLGLPDFATPTGDIGGVPLYELDITQYTRSMSNGFANPTTLWGYALPGQTPKYLGLTFVANEGSPFYVTVTNKLPDQNLLFPIDTTIMNGMLRPNTDIHLHGGHVAPANDGGPLDWFTNDPAYVPSMANGDIGGLPGNSYTYYYPNIQPAAFLWYHEHALGATRINTYLGLAGGYLIRDAAEAALNLPSVATGNETAWVLQDRDFDSTNQLWYPQGPDMLGNGDPLSGLPQPPFDTSYSAVPEHFGNTIVVNGTVWPYMDVEQDRTYRVHLLEGSSARAYDLYLVPEAALDAPNQTVDLNQAVPFYKIGTDQGLLANAELTTHVVFMPGQRLDTLFDFHGVPQGNYILVNRAPDDMSPFGTAFADLTTTGQILQIRVGPNTSGADTFLPQWLTPGNPWPTLNPADAVTTRQFTLTEGFDEYGRLIQFVNGTPYLSDTIMPGMMMPNIMAEPTINTTEIWQWLNMTMDNHPMHTHDVSFQVLGFQALMVDPGDPTMYMPMVDPSAPFYTPDDPAWIAMWGGNWWKGQLDTMICPPGYASSIIMHFDDFLGEYVAHCHILEHEEHDMMGTFRVVPEPSTFALIASGLTGVFGIPVWRRIRK